ncbi:MAG: hypothetical protein LAO22_12960 [Acidobacteriia bacterium]|nr:hypothetical protein [Terriglobia bacterium]
MAGHNRLSAAASPLTALLATGVHTTAYRAITGLVAWAVYSKLGLAILRKAWLNLHPVWAAALGLTSLVTLVM